jgi:hypothetical protein
VKKVFAALALALPLQLEAQQKDTYAVTTEWEEVTTRESGEELPADQISIYTLYRIDEVGQEYVIGNTYPPERRYVIYLATEECATLYVTATDIGQLESQPSNEITVCPGKPSSPGGFKPSKGKGKG